MITISLLDSKDWKEYKKIRLKALKEDPQAFGSSYEKENAFSDEKWQERPSNPDAYIFIAKDGEVSIGLIGFRLEIEEKNAHLWGMFVAKDYRGKGIGKQLMQNAIEKAKKIENINTMTLDVNINQKTAIALYQSLGFQQYGSYKYKMGDGKEHELLEMKKVLL